MTFTTDRLPQNSNLTAHFGTRLVTLHDGRPGLRSGLPVEVRAPASDLPSGIGQAPGEITTPGEKPVLEFIASSEMLDRSDEIISARGWHLDNYRRNPVFQNAHQYGDVIHTLGKAWLTEVREMDGRPVLFQRVEFAVSVNPMARIAYGLYRGGFLNAVSVGFIPLRWADAGDPENPATGSHSRTPPEPGGVSRASSDAPACRRKYLEQELLEVSAVGIPANPEALQLGLKAGWLRKADLADLLDFIAVACPAAFSVSPAQPPPLSRFDTGALFQLARDIRDLMKRL